MNTSSRTSCSKDFPSRFRGRGPHALLALLVIAASAAAQGDAGAALGLVWKDGGTPAAGIGVRWVAGTTPNGPVPAPWTVSDQEGKLRLPPRPTGATVIENDRDPTTFDVATGGAVWALERPARAAVVVRAVDEASVPIAGAWVWYAKGRNPAASRVVGTTGEDGTLRLQSLPKEFVVNALSRAHHPRNSLVIGAEDAAAELVVTLKKGGTPVTVRVLDPGGKPIEGALVRASQECFDCIPPDEAKGGTEDPHAPVLVVATDRNGVAALPALAWRLHAFQVYAKGLGPAYEEWRPVPNQPGGVTLRMAAAAAIEGVLRDANGAPVRGAAVVARVNDFRAPWTTTTDADGRFGFGDLPARGLGVSVATQDGKAEAFFSLEAGETKSLELQLKPQ